MKTLKEQIKGMIESSGIENKAVVALLDEIRKDYHNRKNVGDKVVSQKALSTMVAVIYKGEYPLSRDKKTVFYKGGWRVIRGEGSAKHFVYIGSVIAVKFRRK